MQQVNNAYEVYNPFSSIFKMDEQCKKVQDAKAKLEQIHFIARISRDALKDFKTKEYSKFDALVGETACQIRASKIADLAAAYLSNPIFKEEVDQTLERFENTLKVVEKTKIEFSKKITHAKPFNEAFPEGTSGKKLCEKYNFRLNASDTIGYLVSAYILTLTKDAKEDKKLVYRNEEETLVQNLYDFCKKIGIQITERLPKPVGDLQRYLATSSVKYLFDKIEEWTAQGEDHSALAANLKEYASNDEEQRPVAPCYYNMEVVFNNIFKQKHPLVLYVCRWTEDNKFVDSVKCVYRPSEDGKDFAVSYEPLPEDTPVIFLHGASVDNANATTSLEDYWRKFNSIGLKEILGANWAQHTQLAGKKNKNPKMPADARREYLEQLSHEIGCSRERPKLFLAVHMFCDNYKNAIARDSLR